MLGYFVFYYQFTAKSVDETIANQSVFGKVGCKNIVAPFSGHEKLA